MNKIFKVVAVSSNTNSFGLRGCVLCAKDRTCYEVCRSFGPWNGPDWRVGDVLNIALNDSGEPQFEGCEIPRLLPPAGVKMARMVFAKSFGNGLAKRV